MNENDAIAGLAGLAWLKARARAADLALDDDGRNTCCVVRSERHGVTDPQGVAWEHCHTLADIPVFGGAESARRGSGRVLRAAGQARGHGRRAGLFVLLNP